MSEAAPPLVDVADIVRLVGDASFRRGQAYARGGAVESLEWDAESSRLTARVTGSGAVPYTGRVDIARAANGRSRPTSNSCSCPMTVDCKHVAAILVSANTEHLRHLGLSTRRTAEEWAGDRAEQSRRSAIAVPGLEVAEGPEWKRAFDALALTPTGESDWMHPQGPRHPMALQFELREQPARASDRWRAPGAKRTRASAPSPGSRLGVRPVLRSDRGSWVKSTLTWANILYQVNRLGLEPEQHRWFCQFAPLHRASSEVFLGQEGDWLYLDDFNSPLLWHLFAEAARLGIALVSSDRKTTVSVAGSALVGLDLTSTADALSLAPTLAIDGIRYPPLSAGVIGNHGIYVVEAGRILLAPTAAPLGDEQRWAIAQGAGLAVPTSDVPEFMGEFFPRLRRTLAVASSDDSVELPEVLPPELVLTATFGAKDTLVVAWHWEYRAGTAVTRVGLDADAPGRDPAAEAAILARVAPHAATVPVALAGLDAAEFTANVLSALQGVDGVRVDTVGIRPEYRELTETPELTVSTVETDQRDWFDLGVMVSIGGRSIPFAPIFTALTKGKTKLLLLDKSYLSLEQPVFERLHKLIEEAKSLQEWDTGLRISRYQASLWSEFEDLAEETEQAVSWRSAVAGLMALAGSDSAAGSDSGSAADELVEVPDTVLATLRPYQVDGFRWLSFLWKHQLGGVLADDMGLGKTLQSIALICRVRQEDVRTGPFLVVAPTSVVPNWVSEVHRFAPHLKVVSITATETKGRRPLSEIVAGADIVVTSYTLFRLDHESYASERWDGLILDEAQFVKNSTSLAHRLAKDIDVGFKLAITGTPMENNLLELWSLFSITAPGLFPSARKFAEVYQRPIERGASEPLMSLRRRIRPLMMRRTKDLVAKDLPEKQEQELRIDLAPRHRAIYDTFLQRERQKLLGLIEDIDKNRFIIFRSLTLLRMLSLDASLVDEEFADVPSSKLDALFEQLDDVIAEGHRSLIFSQFTSFLGKAAARLDALGIDYCYLDGSSTNRADIIAKFKTGTAPVFLISLKAGGFGLNLTEADYVFLLDPWWNPASETQAVDRTHRIGQTRNVMVYRLVASDTIEEKVMALKEQKAKLFTAVLDDDAVFSSALTADDIRGLLGP